MSVRSDAAVIALDAVLTAIGVTAQKTQPLLDEFRQLVEDSEATQAANADIQTRLTTIEAGLP